MNTDPALWTSRPVFGVAGGPDEIALTDEGNAHAFSVGAKVRRGGPAEALEALWVAQGEGHLSVRGNGARINLTELGHRFDQIAWGHLRALGLVESFQDERGDGVRLTDAGKLAAQRGIHERTYLLDRCRDAARITPKKAGDKPVPRVVKSTTAQSSGVRVPEQPALSTATAREILGEAE